MNVPYRSSPLNLKIILLVLVGFVCTVVTTRSLLVTQFFSTQDNTHVGRVSEMNQALRNGDIPPRWSKDFGFGYGMPLYNFYAPLPYYVAQLPYTLGFGGVASVKFIYLLQTILAFCGMYLLSSSLWGKRGGLVSSIVFSFSTYRAVDLFVRGALGEAYAMAILPFCLYGIVLLAKKQLRIGFIVTGSSIAALLLSHNLIGMVSIPFIGMFAIGILIINLVSDQNQKILKQSIGMIVAGFCAVGISLYYTLPAFIEKGSTRVDQAVTGGYFDFHNHFLYVRQFFVGIWGYGGSHGLASQMSYVLGTGAVLLACIGIVALCIRGRKYERLMGLLITTLLGLSIFMCSFKSVYIWEHIDALKYLQFPWRFLSIVHVFLGVLCGASVILIRFNKYLIFAILVCLGVIVIRQTPDYQPQSYVHDNNQYFYDDPAKIRSTLSFQLTDYLPKNVSLNSLPKPTSDRINVENNTSIRTIEDKNSLSITQVDCLHSCLVKVNIFQFPGWEAMLDGKRVALIIDQTTNAYTLTIPQGKHLLKVQLMNTPVRAFSNLISLCSIFALGILFCLGKRRRIKEI